MNLARAQKAREEVAPEQDLPIGKTMTPAKVLPDGAGLSVSLSRVAWPEGAAITVTSWIMSARGWEMGGQFTDRGGVKRRRDGSIVESSGMSCGSNATRARQVRIEIETDRPIRTRVEAE